MTQADDLLGKVATEVRPIVRRLLTEPLVPIAKLRDDVEEHLGFLAREQHRNEFLDLARAEDIARRCLALLEHAAETGIAEPAGERLLIQVAARYFAISDDADDDLALDGLADDDSVITAVEALLSTAE